MRRRVEPSLRCRGTDRAEDVIAGVLTVVAAAGLLLAVTAGASAHADAVERSQVETLARVPAVATLTEDAPLVVMVDGPAAHSAKTTTSATWSAPDGSPRTGQVPTSAGGRKGGTVPIWTEHDGTLAEAPTSAATAVLAAVLTGAVIAMVTAMVVGAAWWVTRRFTSMLNARAWDREWAVMEQRWRRNPGDHRGDAHGGPTGRHGG